MTHSNPCRAGNQDDNPPKIPSAPSSSLGWLLSSSSGCQYPQMTFPGLIPGLPFPRAVVARWDTQKVLRSLSSSLGRGWAPAQARRGDEFCSLEPFPDRSSSHKLTTPGPAGSGFCQILVLPAKQKPQGKKMLKEGFYSRKFSSIPLHFLNVPAPRHPPSLF